MSYRDEFNVNGFPAIRAEKNIRKFQIEQFDDHESPTHLQNRRMLVDLQDQMKLLRKDLKRKDNLIQQLSSNVAFSSSDFDSTKIESFLNSALQSGTSKTDVAALQVKLETLQSHIRDLENQVEAREMRIKELKADIEGRKESEARSQALVGSLQNQMREFEMKTGSIDALKSKSELTIRTLQQENSEFRERILELESRLRTHLGEREEIEQQKSSVEKKYKELWNQLTEMLHISEIGMDGADAISLKLSEIIQENALMRGKLITLQETLSNTELESKASRETIMRLVSEVGREQRNMSGFTTELQNLRLERDNYEASKREFTREIELLNERLETTQRAWNATRQELEERERMLNRHEAERRAGLSSYKSSEVELNSLKDTLGRLLQINPQHDSIVERVRHLTVAANETSESVDILHQKVSRLTEQLESQLHRTKEAEHLVQIAESKVIDRDMRIEQILGDMGASDAVRDGLRSDKEKYLFFLEKLSQLMKLDRINSDVGFDFTCDAILSRAEQLSKLEADALADRTTHIYSLQRKLKAMKQQMESKDLHLDLLRKKLASLEERAHGKFEVEKEKDNETLKVRKLQRQLEKSHDLLKNARNEIVELKAQLMECSNLKITCLEQDKDIQGMEKHLEKLERVRQKQAKRISDLKDSMATQGTESEELKLLSENAVGALTSELQTTKMSLDETKKRERQLLDLRQVISRMLGLEINSLSIPDYEIISRLEKLIQAHHSATVSGMTVENALSDMDESFQKGFLESRRLISRGRSPYRKSRARSTSPTRRDTRAY